MESLEDRIRKFLTISSGYGDGSGDGDGYGDGYGVQSFNGQTVYRIDSTPTIITTVHENIAQVFILHSDCTLTPCYIVKGNDKFAHGDTLREAMTALQEKLYDDSTEEERLSAFKEKFPEYDTLYPNTDFFTFHHVLTGSCKTGRNAFAKDHDIDMAGSMTVRQFVTLTSNSYEGEIIRKLPSLYN